MFKTLTKIDDLASSEVKQTPEGILVHIITVAASPAKKPDFMPDMQDVPTACQRLLQQIISAEVRKLQ